jgi:hypothetical protein
MEEVYLGVIKDAFGRVSFTHKTHEKAKEVCEILENLVKWFNVVSVGVTAILSYLSLQSTDQNTTQWQMWTTYVSAFALVTLVAQLSFRPEEQAMRHKSTADRLWFIRERLLNLISDILSEAVSKDKIIERRDALDKELAQTYKDAPNTNRLHYLLARRALNLHNEQSFTDDEINNLLPPSLQK